MTTAEYITEIQKQFVTNRAGEHAYRPALHDLLATMLPHLVVTNEPSREKCGAPDLILQRGEKDIHIPVAFVETKDLGDSDLGGRNKNKEQFERYSASLDNIIFTDYLDFRLYENGEFIEERSVRIAELKNGKIVPIKDNFGKFESLIQHFGNAKPQRITSPAKLAEIMASKARLLAEVIEKTLGKGGGDSSLEGQMAIFKEMLLPEITPKEFADVYAQTIAYGMFAARLHDNTPENFSRAEARGLIPKTNPFLRNLFQYIADIDLDKRISWIVDDLAETFSVADMPKVMSGFGKRTQQTDPMIHFYEDFLSAYDPKLRKSRGVWYTPQAVVNFIVRAVDGILQTEFGLQDGLANTSKLPNSDIHKVQILDPATGTGTFLAETVSQIYEKYRKNQGMWQGYVEQHLLPRLNGFELLMASYAMAHLKLDLLLTQTGYKAVNNERLRIFLTNSLDDKDFNRQTKLQLYQWLANEAEGAACIKRDTPVMVVMGNPPYSGESKNKGEWIMRLMNSYKQEPDTNTRLQERNSKWVNDDYVKFIRLGQYFVDKNTEGVLAYINNHSFIDNPTFRGMRWNLMRSFDKIYIVDLHGNSKKKETAPDGGKDENVFDIQQGVSINIFVKTGQKAKAALAEVYHYDLYGKREVKYDYLLTNDLSAIPFSKLQPSAPEYFFMPKDYEIKAVYDKGFYLPELMPLNGVGMVTKRDTLAYQETKELMVEKVGDIYNLSCEQIRDKYDDINWDSRDGKVELCKKNVMAYGLKDELFTKVSYRPFDDKWTYYTGVSKGFIGWPVKQVMRHLLTENNIGLVVARQCVGHWQYVFVTKSINDLNLTGTAGRFGSGTTFPLYIYPEQTDLLNTVRTPNLNEKIVENIAAAIGLEFEPEKSGETGRFAPIDLLDYIYAVLHSPAYREKYCEFLKIDFPRVPYPTDADEFHRLAALGSELRRLHLMEHSALSDLITHYPVAGSHMVEKSRYEPDADGATGCVWINTKQYFSGVPVSAWNFYIGGYQPAQKWLKDRQGRELSHDDLKHYQQIIKALVMTEEIMKRI